MLVPSAFSSCDESHPPVTRLRAAALFSSPPTSPALPQPGGALSNINNLLSSCRSLQSLLGGPASPMLLPPLEADSPPPLAQLPTPPMSHASPPPPARLRLRSHGKSAGDIGSDKDRKLPRKKIAKRPPPPPRGLNKRRRAGDDDMGREDLTADEEDDHYTQDGLNQFDTFFPSVAAEEPRQALPPAPSTPKRARIAPEVIPLGLERSDYHALHLLEGGASEADRQQEGTDVQREADGELWSTEDDRILVELVLDKLKLTKTDWQDCARSLGKDRHSVGRRWKSLMIGGDVGLKNRSKRSRIHGTWR